MKTDFRTAIFFMLLIFSNRSYSEGNIVFAGITETRGSGAIAGISFRNGYQLAIEEINESADRQRHRQHEQNRPSRP